MYMTILNQQEIDAISVLRQIVKGATPKDLGLQGTRDVSGTIYYPINTNETSLYFTKSGDARIGARGYTAYRHDKIKVENNLLSFKTAYGWKNEREVTWVSSYKDDRITYDNLDSAIDAFTQAVA